MSLSSLFERFVINNPMNLEGVRAWRRFLRTGGDTGRAVNFTILALLGVLYLWLLASILIYAEDMSLELLFLELTVLTLAVPASLYGAISGERERLTWDALLLTRLSPGQILFGKLLWRMGMVVAVMLVFLPPIALSHWVTAHAGMLGHYHNVNDPMTRSELTVPALMRAHWCLFTWSLLLAGFSLLVSARTKRTVTSLTLVAVTLFGFALLCPMLISLFGGNEKLNFNDPPIQQLGALLLDVHPFYCLAQIGQAFYRGQGGSGYTNTDFIAHMSPWLYLGGALFCLRATWKTLRGLGAARRRMF